MRALRRREGFIANRKRHDAPGPVRDDKSVATLGAKVEEDQGLSMCAIKRELNVSERTVRRVVYEEPCLRFYALWRARF